MRLSCLLFLFGLVATISATDIAHSAGPGGSVKVFINEGLSNVKDDDEFSDIFGHVDAARGSAIPPTVGPTEAWYNQQILDEIKQEIKEKEDKTGAAQENIRQINIVVDDMKKESEKQRIQMAKNKEQFEKDWAIKDIPDSIATKGPTVAPVAPEETTPPAGGHNVDETTTTGPDETTTTGSDETKIPGSDETTTTGSDEATKSGSDETTTSGSDETKIPGSDETTTTGSDEATKSGSDETTTTGSDETTTTGSDETKIPGSDETTTTGSDENTTIGSDETTTTGSDEATTAGSDETKIPGSDETTTTGSDEATKSGSDETTTTGSDETKIPGSDETTTTGSDETTTTGSDETKIPGSDETTTTGSDENTTIGSDETTTTGSDEATTASPEEATTTGSEVEKRKKRSANRSPSNGVHSKLRGTLRKPRKHRSLRHGRKASVQGPGLGQLLSDATRDNRVLA